MIYKTLSLAMVIEQKDFAVYNYFLATGQHWDPKRGSEQLPDNNTCAAIYYGEIQMALALLGEKTL